jgi:alanyl-tRNA synthetase
MTDRLYYTDPYLREFDAAVARIETRGPRRILILDRTAFYPSSGGQPFDTGTLTVQADNGSEISVPITDVVDDDDGSVAHVVAPEAPDVAVGARVRGAIDWPRRFDHMQQHTGQHVLSAAFDRLFAVRTVSFHLGEAASTIDLAREVSARELASAEAEANRVVWDDRPVTIRFASAADAAAMPLRKESARQGTLRLIDVDGFDLSACGGTHVARTGGIGIIAVSGAERFKGGSRVEFVCGARALARFRLLRDVAATAGRLLSVGPEDVGPSIERLQAESRDVRRLATALQSELARFRAADLAAGAEPVSAGASGARQLVVRAVDADANAVKQLAAAVTARPGFVVVLATASTPAVVVVARSSDVSLQANELLAAVTATFGGKGGGRPELAQAGGVAAAPEELFAKVRALLQSSTSAR